MVAVFRCESLLLAVLPARLFPVRLRLVLALLSSTGSIAVAPLSPVPEDPGSAFAVRRGTVRRDRFFRGLPSSSRPLCDDLEDADTRLPSPSEDPLPCDDARVGGSSG